jgi:GNAT superfamily N-acetyltransferase
MQTLEMFTDERFRGRGIASALSAFLTAAGILDRSQTLAVFNETTQRIAERMEFIDVQRYEWNGTDWVRIVP